MCGLGAAMVQVSLKRGNHGGMWRIFRLLYMLEKCGISKNLKEWRLYLVLFCFCDGGIFENIFI